jgi:hypothetical protein
MQFTQIRRKPLAITGTPVTTMHEGEVEPGFTCTAVNAISGATFAVDSGTLPTGITFNSSTGLFSGTPSQSGTFADIVLKVTDGKSRVATLPAFTLTVTAVPTFTVADQTTYFGALTASGAGGFQVVANNTISAATIDSGDASGHFQISSSGVITPTATGDSANLSGGPYTLGCSFTDTSAANDTATITINVTANAYSVSSATEFNSAITALGTPASLAGARSILCRAGSYGNISLSAKAFANVVTVAPHTGQTTEPTFGRINLSNGTTKVTLSGITIFSDYIAGTDSSTIAIVRVDGSTNIIIDDCDISSTALSGITMQANPTTLQAVGTQSAGTATSITVTNNFIHECNLPIRLKAAGATVNRNTFENCFQSFGEFYGACSNITYTNNRGMGIWARGGSGFDTGDPHSSLLGFTPLANVDVDTILIEGNVLCVGTNRLDAKGDYNGFATGPKFNDTNDGYGFTNVTVRSNLFVSNGNIGFEWAFLTDAVFEYNTLVIASDTVVQTAPGLNYHDILTGCSASNNAWAAAPFLGTNLDPGHYPGNVDASFTFSNNNATGSASYSTIFDGPSFSGLTTTAAALAAFSAKAGGALATASPKIGAVGTYYNFDTDTSSYP